MRKIVLSTILILILFSSQAFARGVGTSAANLLKKGYGARPAGMGSAFVAVADDFNSLEWNPAGLARLTPDYFDAAFEHVFWFGDVEYELLSFAQNLGETYGAGTQFLYRHMPDIDNNLVDEKPQKVWDFVWTVGYGFQLQNFAIGVNLKLIATQLGSERLIGEAADLGIMVNFMEDKLTIGLSVQNLGPDMNTDSLPLNIMGGLAFKDAYGSKKQHAIVGSLEVDQPLDNKMYLRLGFEYWYAKAFAARVGYAQQLGANDLQSDVFFDRLTVGASIRWADLQLDYAFVPYADLGSTHRLTLKLHYGPLTDNVDNF